MGNKMLIDAAHPEETRVVVLRGNRVEEFDYESATKKQLRGNIYLAKVTRVEPSLQAAFVNYGGNRHGFLAFSEIHPDYYQLPMAERQALKQQEEHDTKAEATHDDGHDDDVDAIDPDTEQPDDDHPVQNGAGIYEAHDGEDNDGEHANQTVALEAVLPATRYASTSAEEHDDTGSDPGADNAADDQGDKEDVRAATDDNEHDDNGADHDDGDLDHVVSVGSEDALEEVPQRLRRRRRSYKIQEVIKRGQILLIQVVKEERGNKGAALTTYMSLAGRYTVLMPNTASGGGISRKISSASDRKRLREIATELDVPEGMGLIIRTAGAARTKSELKRDYEYLLRLWENVREFTLKSSAPCLVYEEGDLIKRSIRDLYSREIDEILVAGDDAYRDAKDFMRMLMPSHAKNVQPYKEPEPLFTRYEVERQLNAMYSPQVTLPSGGYIIINQTEALVAVDVNSGKSTREFSIEDTALNTNLEAAEEIARQLRLRDLAGLIVVDFIDMEEKRNNRSVERKLKDCLRDDRARIQVGRISLFGLLEMSRQRIRTGMVEGSTIPCVHCQGTGIVRSTESVALSVLRSLDDWLRANTPCHLNAVAAIEVVLYIINQKRAYLQDIESRHGVNISITASDRMQGASFHIEKVAVLADGTEAGESPISQSDRIIQPFEIEANATVDEQGRGTGSRRRRRRGGRRNEERDNRANAAQSGDEEAATTAKSSEAKAADAQDATSGDGDGEESGKPRRRSRRRGRRGGRQQRAARAAEAAKAENQDNQQPDSQPQDGGHGDNAASETAQSDSPAPAEHEHANADAHPHAHAHTDQGSHGESEHATQAEPAAPAHDDTRSFRGKTNGAGKTNGRGKSHDTDHQDAEKDVAQSQPEQIDVKPEPKPKAPPPPPAEEKPRGNRRGWWQKREEA